MELFFLVGSLDHASHTASQGNAKEKTTLGISGQKCLGLYKSYDRTTSWGRMFSELLVGMGDWYSRRCALNWSLKATKYNRMYFQLAVSTLRTDATESGLSQSLLLTPTTREEVQDLDKFKARMEKYPNGTTMPNLATQVVTGLLPTPTAVQREHPDRVEALKQTGVKSIYSRANGECRPNSIIDYMCFHGILPTPATRDYKGARSKEALEASGRNHTNSLPDSFAQTGRSSQLNPQFVAEMMGFPTDWTLLPFQNGEASQ